MAEPLSPRPKVPEWVHKMDAYLVRYAVPLTFGRRPHPKTVADDINVASGAAIDFVESQFLLTAAHVIAAALERLKEPLSHFMAGPLELKLDPGTVQLCPELDVATVPLTPRDLSVLEADGLHIIRPPTWPPPSLRRDDPVVLAGFPGPWRRQLSWDELDFRSFTMLALVHEIREDEFVCQIDREFLVERRILPQEELPPLDLRGLSGGPTLLVRNNDRELIAPQLCGIVKEGWNLGDGNVIVKYARLDCLDRSGRIYRPPGS